jgi:hypothetical protein
VVPFQTRPSEVAPQVPAKLLGQAVLAQPKEVMLVPARGELRALPWTSVSPVKITPPDGTGGTMRAVAQGYGS